jgi:CRISPR system Cascade subunit CasA
VEDRRVAAPGPAQDQPTWVSPIVGNAPIQWNEIGLMRGLFWQPVRLRLVKSPHSLVCGVLGDEPVPGYCGFIAEPDFKFKIAGVWPHPHGSIKLSVDGNSVEQKFLSFNTTAPAWTQLSEFVLPRGAGGGNQAGSTPAGPISQFEAMGGERLDILIGGYRTNQASVLERRHELIGLAQGWLNEKNRIGKLVAIGLDARDGLSKAIFTTSFGLPGMKGTGLFRKKKGRKRIQSVNDAHGFHEHAEKLFYARTESLIHQTFSSEATFLQWGDARRAYAQQVADHCRAIFAELTDPYALKPELIPVIAWSRRALNNDLKKLMEDNT